MRLKKRNYRKPHFIIGGAPRSGTSFLYEFLKLHQEIFMAEPISPEPKFFLCDERYSMGFTYYTDKWFKESENYQICGEKSTNYLESKASALRIKENIPNVKLIFMLRNPIERAYSNYLWTKKNKLEQLSFKEAIIKEHERESEYTGNEKYSRPYSYISRGIYWKLLQPYFDLFPSENIKILEMDTFFKNPTSSKIDIFKFLKVKNINYNYDFNIKINSANDSAKLIDKEDYETLRKIYFPENQKLYLMLGKKYPKWDFGWNSCK